MECCVGSGGNDGHSIVFMPPPTRLAVLSVRGLAKVCNGSVVVAETKAVTAKLQQICERRKIVDVGDLRYTQEFVASFALITSCAQTSSWEVDL